MIRFNPALAAYNTQQDIAEREAGREGFGFVDQYKPFANNPWTVRPAHQS
jgi:hypothetical protein